VCRFRERVGNVLSPAEEVQAMGVHEMNGHHTEEERLAELPMAALLRRLSDQTSLLVREEVALAKAELAEKGRHAGKGAGMFGAAGSFGFYAFGALTAAAILALDLILPGWLAATIVGVAYALIAGIAALAGRRQLRQAGPAVPEQTVETLKEDVRWTKARAQAARTS
jgi:Putative Actinobacterial Holin-X, holin superfamily III